MNNEKDHLPQTFATFQIPGMAHHHRPDHLADQDTTLLPQTAHRHPDCYSCNRRHRSWWDHRLPHHRLSQTAPVLRKGGVPCSM